MNIDSIYNDINPNALIPISNGGSTDDSNPLITGSGAEPNSTITIRTGPYAQPIYVHTDAEGNWQIVARLPEGTSHLQVAGPDGVYGDVYTVTVATPVPQILQIMSDGQFPTDPHSIGSELPIFYGVAEAKSTVSVYDGNTLIGEARADLNGNWQLQVPYGTPLVEGEHAIHVVSSNGKSSDFDLTVDHTPVGPPVDPVDPVTPVDPVPPVEPPVQPPVEPSNPPVIEHVYDDSGTTPIEIGQGQTTHDTTPALSGHAEPNSLVTLFDGRNPIGTTTANGNGEWSYQITNALNDGVHSITVVDSNGQTSAPINFEVAEIAPPVQPPVPDSVVITGAFDDRFGDPVEIAPDGHTQYQRPLLAGTAQPFSTVNIYDNGELVASGRADANGNWTANMWQDLDSGEHSLTAVDSAGHQSASFELVIDAPAAATITAVYDNDNGSLIDIPAGSHTQDSTPLLTGTAQPFSYVTIQYNGQYFGSTNSDKDGNWSFQVDYLPPGQHSFVVVGSTGPYSEPFNLFVDPPSLPEPASITGVYDNNHGDLVDIAKGSHTQDQTPLLTGTAQAFSPITIVDNGIAIGFTTADEHGNWTFETNDLAYGQHLLAAIDNSGQSSQSFYFFVDPDTGPVTPPPVDPVDPVTPPPVDPVDPVTPPPVDPVDPVTPPPVDPVDPVTPPPVDPVDPVTPPPVDPTHPVDPAPVTTLHVVQNGNYEGDYVPDHGVTSDWYPAFVGDAPAGSAVQLYLNNQPIDSVRVGDNGHWGWSTQSDGGGYPLADGTYTIQAFVNGVAGESVTFTVDGPAPSIDSAKGHFDGDSSFQDIADGSANHDVTNFSMNGEGRPFDTLTIFNGQEEVATVTVDAAGKWSYDPSYQIIDGELQYVQGLPLAAGEYHFTVVSGANGKVSGELDFTVDSGNHNATHTDTLSVHDLLVDHDGQLFADDAHQRNHANGQQGAPQASHAAAEGVLADAVPVNGGVLLHEDLSHHA